MCVATSLACLLASSVSLRLLSVVCRALCVCCLASAAGCCCCCCQIEPREEQCFYEDLVRDGNFRLEFEVVRGGLLDCKIKITDPMGGTVLEKIAFFNKEVSESESSADAVVAPQYLHLQQSNQTRPYCRLLVPLACVG